MMVRIYLLLPSIIKLHHFELPKCYVHANVIIYSLGQGNHYRLTDVSVYLAYVVRMATLCLSTVHTVQYQPVNGHIDIV